MQRRHKNFCYQLLFWVDFFCSFCFLALSSSFWCLCVCVYVCWYFILGANKLTNKKVSFVSRECLNIKHFQCGTTIRNEVLRKSCTTFFGTMLGARATWYKNKKSTNTHIYIQWQQRAAHKNRRKKIHIMHGNVILNVVHKWKWIWLFCGLVEKLFEVQNFG